MYRSNFQAHPAWDEFTNALKQMKKGEGRDFFEEAQMEETKRREAVEDQRSVLSENRGSEATPLFGVDARPPLSSGV